MHAYKMKFNSISAKYFVNSLYVPPYKSLVEITSSPGFNNLIIASIAASPEAKANP